MIKKARIKNIFRTITGTLDRFFAIAAIVALGAGFFGGLEATCPDMKNAADSYMDKYSWYDLDIVNQLGFNQDEMDLISQIEGIEKIQEAKVLDDVFLDSQKKRLTMRVFGILPEKGEPEMNGFELKQGSYPSDSGECLVQITGLYSASLPEIGDTFYLLDENSGNYRYKSVKVSGIVQGPMFFSAELEPSTKGSGSLDMALYVRKDFFTGEDFNHIYLALSGSKEMDTWSNEYKNLISDSKDKIRKKLEHEIYGRMDMLENAGRSLAGIFDAAKDADEKLYEAEKSSGGKHTQVMEILLKNGASQNLTDALKSDFEKSPEKNRTDFETAKKSVSGLIEKINGYRGNIFSVEDRNQSTGFASYKDNIEKIASLSRVFPAFFFFIALLVALTTMTRLVEEKRTEIGTLKSIGFSGAQLLGQYLLYALLSSLAGCIAGLAIGFKLFPAAVTFSYSMMYTVPLGKLPFRWEIALPVSIIAIGVILTATVAACLSETIARPAVLMSPKAPAPGKRIFLERITFIWKRLNFSRKVTLRNMFRYKKRLWMTLAGVAGCSALLVAGFGLRDSLQDIITVQYDDLSVYNVYLMLGSESSFEEDSIIKNFLNDKSAVSKWMKISGESVKIKKAGKEMSLTLYVPDDEKRMNDFMVLRTRKGHKEIPFGNGIIITEKQCEILGIKTGDIVTIENNEGISKEVKVLGESECYMYGNVYASVNEYKKLFGKEPVFNSAVCNLTDEKNNQETISSMMESPNVIYAMWIDSLLESAHKNIAAINVVVFVIIITSGFLSIIVLYNLTNINICERKREIATLLVLGYTETESRKYIFREINLLSFLGTVLGLFLGGPLHSLVVHAVEVNVIMWGRSMHPASYIYAVLVSLVFTVFVNLIMRKSVTKINMVESLKSKD